MSKNISLILTLLAIGVLFAGITNILQSYSIHQLSQRIEKLEQP